MAVISSDEGLAILTELGVVALCRVLADVIFLIIRRNSKVESNTIQSVTVAHSFPENADILDVFPCIPRLPLKELESICISFTLGRILLLLPLLFWEWLRSS